MDMTMHFDGILVADKEKALPKAQDELLDVIDNLLLHYRLIHLFYIACAKFLDVDKIQQTLILERQYSPFGKATGRKSLKEVIRKRSFLRIEILLDAVLDSIRGQMLACTKRYVEDALLAILCSNKNVCMVCEAYTAEVIAGKCIYRREVKRQYLNFVRLNERIYNSLILSDLYTFF